MNRIKKSFLLWLLNTSVFATNPIEWQIIDALPEVVTPGNTYIATVRFTNGIAAQLAQDIIISGVGNPSSDFSFENGCANKRLLPRAFCDFKILLTPNSTGTKQLQLVQQYGYDVVQLPLMRVRSQNSLGTSIGGQLTTPLPAKMNPGRTAPWKFTFTNSGTIPASGVSVVVNGSDYTSTCGATLGAPPETNTCEVSGNYLAGTAGPHEIAASFYYTQGRPVIVKTNTVVAGAGNLVCSAANPLPPQSKVNTSTAATLLCVNQSGSDVIIDSRTATYPTGGAEGTFVPDANGGDNCTAQTLANGASCQLKGTYTAPSSPINNVSIALQVTYHTATQTGLIAQASTSTDVVTTISNKRVIHLMNQCNFPVWWSMVGGAVSNTGSCTSDADCPQPGSTCNTAAKICYYNNYGPTAGGYQLVSSNGTATTEIIETAASTMSDQILWKGLISASTQCSGSTCENNGCQNNGGQSACQPGVGFDQPATLAEFTFKLTGSGNVDSYDISNVNGFSMPISMGTNQTSSAYQCGIAGNHQDAAPLKACHFDNIAPPTNMYYWVSHTNTACLNNNSCSDQTQICGLAFDKTANNFVKNCGNFLGFWAANQICQTAPNFTSPFGDNFSCQQALSTPFPANTYTLTQLLKCSPPVSNAPLFNSCYLNYSDEYAGELNQCCGCSDWDGIATPTASCPLGQINPQWTQYVDPIIRWMKAACPTSYAYPFDDKASSFQCTASEVTEYTITFCPGGDTGLPSGKVDGRG